MVVCACHFDLLLLDQPTSLKGKRQVVRHLKDRIRSKFGAATAEVGSQELLHRAELGIAMVSEDQDVLESMVGRIRSAIEGDGTVEVLSWFADYHRYTDR